MNNRKYKNYENIIIGRNSIREALRVERSIDTIYISKGSHIGAINEIIKKAKEKDILIKQIAQQKMDFMCNSKNHQGIIAIVAQYSYSTIDDILLNAEEKGELPFIVVADQIEDPHNLGAIIRTAECAGAHGIIIPKRRSAGLTYAVNKASAGALEYMPIARVTNVASTLDELKKKSIWIYGADITGSNWCETNLKGAIALVIGSEGYGISKLVREKCDFIVSLPMMGNINSLNASVAAGILMYEICRQRKGILAK